MRLRSPVARIVIALATAAVGVILQAGVALGHPESEGSHPSGCVVTVEPASVTVGGKFTVSGNFGGASIYLVKGANASPAEGAAADVTTPAGSAFSVTVTAEASDVGVWTVWGLLPESECGDSDGLTVTAGMPNTALAPEPGSALPGGVVLLFAAALTAVLKRRSAQGNRVAE